MEFDKNYKDKYPLKLKKEGISTFDASFWDLSIIIDNKKSKTSKPKLFDKTEAFHYNSYAPFRWQYPKKYLICTYRLWNFKVSQNGFWQ